MNQNDKNSLFVLVGLVAVIVGFIFSSKLVHAPKTGSVQVDVVTEIPATFPDVVNNPTYNNFLNPGALDPTQVVQFGNSNTTPFNSQ